MSNQPREVTGARRSARSLVKVLYTETAKMIRGGRAKERHRTDEYAAGYVDAYREMQRQLAHMFRTANPNFDQHRFDKECEP